MLPRGISHALSGVLNRVPSAQSPARAARRSHPSMSNRGNGLRRSKEVCNLWQGDGSRCCCSGSTRRCCRSGRKRRGSGSGCSCRRRATQRRWSCSCSSRLRTRNPTEHPDYWWDGPDILFYGKGRWLRPPSPCTPSPLGEFLETAADVEVRVRSAVSA